MSIIATFISRARQLLRFALPIIGTQMINVIVPFIGFIFVARIGKNELAAAGLATSTFITIFVCGNGSLNAIGILISHQNQQHATRAVRALFWAGTLWSLLLGCLLCGALWHIQSLLVLFGQDPNLIQITIPYFEFARFCIIPMLLTNAINQFYIGIGQPRVSLIVSLIVAPFTIVLSYGLILGRFGLPRLELSGLILATLITGVLSVLILVCRLYHRQYRPFQLIALPSRKELAVVKKIIQLGLPISVQSGAELIAITITTYFMGWFGADALSAAQIVNQYIVIAVMVYIGLSQAVAILSSKAFATQDFRQIKQYTVSAIGIMSLVFVVIACVFVLWPSPLIELFLDKLNPSHDHILALGRLFFIIAIATNYIDSIRFVFSGAYRGLHDSKKPMIVNIICLWAITITSSYVLGEMTPLGPAGIRIGIGLGIACAAVYLMWDFYGRKLPEQARLAHHSRP